MKNLLLFLILSSLNSVAYEQQLETVGYPDTTTQVNVYTGWTNQGLLTFSGNAEVQNTQPSDYQGASGAGNIFFTNTPGTYFEISDFPPDTVSNIHIMYGIRNYDTLRRMNCCFNTAMTALIISPFLILVITSFQMFPGV